jgi:hypothetical protein
VGKILKDSAIRADPALVKAVINEIQIDKLALFKIQALFN